MPLVVIERALFAIALGPAADFVRQIVRTVTNADRARAGLGGIADHAGWTIGGCVHLGLAVTAVKLALDLPQRTAEHQTQIASAALMSRPFGQLALVVSGTVLILVGLQTFYQCTVATWIDGSIFDRPIVLFERLFWGWDSSVWRLVGWCLALGARSFWSPPSSAAPPLARPGTRKHPARDRGHHYGPGRARRHRARLHRVRPRRNPERVIPAHQCPIDLSIKAGRVGSRFPPADWPGRPGGRRSWANVRRLTLSPSAAPPRRPRSPGG